MGRRHPDLSTIEHLLAEQKKGMRESRDFGYWGEAKIGELDIFAWTHHRDSGILAESNWDVITEDMTTRFPHHTWVESFSHWAVGWGEWLIVRLKNEKGQITGAGVAWCEWKRNMDNYPVADDDHYSEREFEAIQEHIADGVKFLHIGRYPNREKADVIDPLPDDYVLQIYGWLSDHDWDFNDGDTIWISEDKLIEAMTALGFLIPEPPEPEYDENGDEIEVPPSEWPIIVDTKLQDPLPGFAWNEGRAE